MLSLNLRDEEENENCGGRIRPRRGTAFVVLEGVVDGKGDRWSSRRPLFVIILLLPVLHVGVVNIVRLE